MKNLFIYFFGLLLLFSGCEDNVLDKAPRDFFTYEDIWSDLNLVKQFQTRLYNRMESWSLHGHKNIMLASFTDDAFSAENLAGVYSINLGNITADNIGGLDIWSLMYEYIRIANLFLENIEVVEMDDEEKSILIGETKFIRAYYYFNLVRNYVGVPLIKSAFSLDDEFQVARNSFEECIDWIIDEIDEAYSLLPLLRTNNDYGRIDKAICLGTKAEVLLQANSKLYNPNEEPRGPLFDYTKNSWEECAKAAKEIFDMGHFELQEVNNADDYHNIFIHPNNEIIFSKVHSLEFHSSDYNSINKTNGILKMNGYMETQPLQGLIDEFEMSNGKRIYEENSGYDDSPESIYKNRDLRFYANFLFLNSSWQGHQVDLIRPDGFDVTQKNTSTGYWLIKLMDESLNREEEPAIYPRLRLATIYLIYAEAQYELGNEEEARKYLNKVRNRVHLPDVTKSGEELFEAIQHERRIELCFENYRFFDVRRWKIASKTENMPAKGIHWFKINPNGDNGLDNLEYSIVTYQERKFENKFYYLPIPRSEINRTDLLEQNPGY